MRAPPNAADGYEARIIAELLGVSVRRLQQLSDEGYVSRLAHGKYPLVGAVQGYIKFLKSRQPQEKSERARLEGAQRAKIEMQLRRQRGELLPAAMADETLNVASNIFIGELDGRASRLANEIAGKDPPAARDLILEDNRRIRNVVADHLERRAAALAAMRELGAEVAPAAQTDAEPVGGREQELPAGEPGTGAVPG